ncbi:hypothetical protein ACFV1W_21485 [Kitasatospora sp. NPDC059648]|uniref:hypothetical protein n=1 Tax=Kitasatospora sp. NPDC059648 TaxID=3346894 RepID=UPI0036C6D879
MAPLPVDLALLHELLDVEDHWPPIVLLRNARAVRGHLPPLVLSVAELAGSAMGPGSRDELRRMRDRAALYERITADLDTVRGARVLKGPSLAARYPAGVLRPLGDLDVVVPDEAALWDAARLVVRDWPVDELDVSLLDDGGTRHLLVTLRWPAEDPMLDPEPKIEISTFAYPGEPGLVPMRATPPEDRLLADVLALAEERFQRPFTAKDRLDLAVVLASAEAPVVALVAAAEHYHLAPELLELCESVRTVPSLRARVPDELTAALAGPAARETDRRAAGGAPDAPVEGRDGPAEGTEGPAWAGTSPEVAAALAAGQPVHGLLLRRPEQPGPDLLSRTRTVGAGTLLATPIGDFLLVTGELVDPEQYQAALAALDD